MAFLPLILADRAVGVLTLYAEDVDFFDADEMKLLGELAGDIAFAIAHLDKTERIDYLALYDVLTGLANRTLFLERVSQYARTATTNGHQMALFLVDIKGFKNINDSLGWAVGDALLRLVGAWLSERVGDVNLVARVGADHFAVVLPVVIKNGSVLHLVEQTMDRFLEHPFRLTDAVLRIGAQVGIAVFPGDGDSADTLLKNAEAALKQTKATGERCLFYTDTMTRNVAVKLTLENKLRRALDRNEFELYYQPKINLASGKLTGAEALIRWNDPATGLVPPAQFIPILEETGLIYEVGRWALHQALADRLCWRSTALSTLRVAVNVSPRQLRHRSFIADIKRAVSIDPEAASTLELEITESVIMADVKGCIATLNAIRALGVIVAIDDFGTGFSSLSYLAKLPVDILKIDRSFVVEMTTGPQGMALVAAVINVAHALRLNVVAEGVETDEQKRLLQVLNCDEMQGFLFARPMPVSEFEAKFLAR